ncbi:MAG: hypothetical protein J6I50_04425 [Clostridia bacterium]|nr:hypothetical protein [Clostridia bacterium]
MKHLCRTSIVFTALLAVSSIICACGDADTGKTQSKETEAVTTSSVTETETEDDRIPSSLPTDLDFGGDDLNIWYFTKNSDVSEHFLDLVGNPEGDIIEVALYERNRAIEEQLNVSLTYTDLGVASSDVGGAIRKVIMANDDTYDLYNVIQWNTSALALEHCFLNLSNAPYLDLSAPWWSQSYINSTSIGKDHIYFLAGDISIDMIRCIAAFYFNKNMYINLYDTTDVIYQEVMNGQWTYDKMISYITDSYSDLNGDGQVNEGDRYGLVTNSYNNIDAFSFGMGAVLTQRDADNLPYLTIGDEQNVNIYNNIYKMITETNGAMMNKTADTATLENVQTFSNGYALFLPGFLYTAENLRDMKEDYGIIPFPKYDESQENYYSAVHDIATLMCVPTTCTKLDTVCATLEAMAYYSYYNVTPIYYETALKTKYTRDDISSNIIDIIHDTSMTDIAYVYSSKMADMGMIMRTLAAAKNKDYASYYAKREKTATKQLAKFITTFEEDPNE